MFQEVFEQAGRDGRSEVFILVRTPFQDERPNCLGFLFGKHAYLNYGLPPWILGTIRRSMPWEKSFSGFNRLLYSHQAPLVMMQFLRPSFYKLLASYKRSSCRKLHKQPRDC